MWKSVATTIVIACVAFLAGCESKSTEHGDQQSGSAAEAQHAEDHEGEGHTHGGDEHAHEGEGHHHNEEGHHADDHHGGDHHGESGDDESTPDDSEPSTVSVAENGTKFDPAVEVSRLPDGVWYCEMDKSHYASKTKGDGKCPVCGMKLKKKKLKKKGE
jgi:hypothetical protein